MRVAARLPFETAVDCRLGQTAVDCLVRYTSDLLHVLGMLKCTCTHSPRGWPWIQDSHRAANFPSNSNTLTGVWASPDPLGFVCRLTGHFPWEAKKNSLSKWFITCRNESPPCSISGEEIQHHSAHAYRPTSGDYEVNPVVGNLGEHQSLSSLLLAGVMAQSAGQQLGEHRWARQTWRQWREGEQEAA